MQISRKLKTAVAAGTAAAVMLSSASMFNVTRSLFFSSFIVGACSQQTEKPEEVEYHFALFDFFIGLFS